MHEDLAYLGHPILRKKARIVLSLDPAILDLIAHLKATVLARRGLGLAAPQVGAQVSIIVARFPEENDEGSMLPGEPKVYINPVVSHPSLETWIEEEGCLSIPKIYGHVERPKGITVEYVDEHWISHTENLFGWPARIIMHENDHLNGVLFIDRLPPSEKKAFSSDLNRLKKHYKNSNDHIRLWKEC